MTATVKPEPIKSDGADLNIKPINKKLVIGLSIAGTLCLGLLIWAIIELVNFLRNRNSDSDSGGGDSGGDGDTAPTTFGTPEEYGWSYSTKEISNVAETYSCVDCNPNLSSSDTCADGSYGSYVTCSGECCCDFEECDGNCQPKDGTLSEDSIAHMTHYWDCCKPSCAWNDKSGDYQVWSCDNTGENERDGGEGDANKSICEGGSVGMCKRQMPWIGDGNNGEDNVLYGYVANSGDGVGCGKCYELEFSNARNISKAYVMVTNGGDSSSGNFDLLVPGGGFGEFNGCTDYGGWDEAELANCSDDTTTTNVKNCSEYGGFWTIEQCASTFPDDDAARKSCENVLFGVFPQKGCNLDPDGIPQYMPDLYISNKTNITCPSELLDGVAAGTLSNSENSTDDDSGDSTTDYTNCNTCSGSEFTIECATCWTDSYGSSSTDPNDFALEAYYDNNGEPEQSITLNGDGVTGVWNGNDKNDVTNSNNIQTFTEDIVGCCADTNYGTCYDWTYDNSNYCHTGYYPVYYTIDSNVSANANNVVIAESVVSDACGSCRGTWESFREKSMPDLETLRDKWISEGGDIELITDTSSTYYGKMRWSTNNYVDGDETKGTVGLILTGQCKFGGGDYTWLSGGNQSPNYCTTGAYVSYANLGDTIENKCINDCGGQYINFTS